MRWIDNHCHLAAESLETALALAASAGVEAVPGASAVLAALVVSGLPTGRFCFEGFLPRKGVKRGDRIAALVNESRTTVLFEAPHRLTRTLAELAQAMGDVRRIAIVREQTKLHEEVWRGTLGAAVLWAQANELRGEHVLVLAGSDELPTPTEAQVRAAFTEQVAEGLSRRDAAIAVAKDLGVSRRVVYQLSLKD